MERLTATELGFLEEEINAGLVRAIHAFNMLRERIARRRNRLALDEAIGRPPIHA